MRLDAPVSWVFLLLDRNQPRDGVLLAERTARVGVADVLRLRHLTVVLRVALLAALVLLPVVGAMVTMLYRDAGEPESSAASDASGWAAEAVGWARSEGLVSGSELAFAPAADANRAQIVVIVSRYLKPSGGI